MDKKEARPDEVLSLTFDLMVELGASDDQLDFPYLYAIGREGRAWREEPRNDLHELFQVIVEHVPPPRWTEGPFQLLVANLDHSPYLGRVAIGKVARGRVRKGETVAILKEGASLLAKVAAVYTHQGLERVEVEESLPGDIVAVAGAEVGERVRAEFVIPARALFGFRSLFLSLTGGEGLLSHTFHGYGPEAGPIPTRTTGSAVAMEAGWPPPTA